MKKVILFYLLIPLLCISYAFINGTYDAKFVTFSSYSDGQLTYNTIKLDRKDNHVKVKYFASKDFDGTLVPLRYEQWSKGRNIIASCSGTYMQSCNPTATPVGLTIDQGRVVNKTINDSMDAIVIVSATGGIEVSNIKDGNLSINNKTYNLKNSLDKGAFLSWAQKSEATVFQTHLLVYKGDVKIYEKSSPTMRERRFLIAGIDKKGNTFNFIVQVSNPVTLLKGTKSVVNYLKEQENIQNILYMINLDTGCQDYFRAYNSDGSPKKVLKSDGTEKPDFKGTVEIDKCVNLLSFYFE